MDFWSIFTRILVQLLAALSSFVFVIEQSDHATVLHDLKAA